MFPRKYVSIKTLHLNNDKTISELYLEPATRDYDLAAGTHMRVAFIHSNENLSSSDKQIGGKILYGGPVLGTSTDVKDLLIKVNIN